MMPDRPKKTGTWGLNTTIAFDQFHYLFEDVHRLISLSVKSTLAKLHNSTHFHDVTYDHIWSKILQELTKSPA